MNPLVGFRSFTNLIQWFPDMILRNPDWSAIFAPTGRFLQEGETIHRTNYSRTLAAIAEKGVQAFYSVSSAIWVTLL